MVIICSKCSASFGWPSALCFLVQPCITGSCMKWYDFWSHLLFSQRSTVFRVSTCEWEIEEGKFKCTTTCLNDYLMQWRRQVYSQPELNVLIYDNVLDRWQKSEQSPTNSHLPTWLRSLSNNRLGIPNNRIRTPLDPLGEIDIPPPILNHHLPSAALFNVENWSPRYDRLLTLRSM